MIERWSARAMHSPRFLTHGNDTCPGFLGGREVNMAHFREGIPDGVINRALTDFSTLNVRNRYAQG
jgi:hypothetical protein